MTLLTVIKLLKRFELSPETELITISEAASKVIGTTANL